MFIVKYGGTLIPSANFANKTDPESYKLMLREIYPSTMGGRLNSCISAAGVLISRPRQQEFFDDNAMPRCQSTGAQAAHKKA